ncbi:MAG: SRPBCC domain-containing protein, partial [Bacteroidota bacterium]|nr:SRPBCC domain-containing protein [Bacteroidota bacterium]
MTSNHQTKIQKDAKNNRLQITREFAAPVEQVWNAWTNSEILDLWWAPKPWKTETKSMNFSVGGRWLYSMAGRRVSAIFVAPIIIRSFPGRVL